MELISHSNGEEPREGQRYRPSHLLVIIIIIYYICRLAYTELYHYLEGIAIQCSAIELD